jgi:flavin reductase (DIM6/NTAB) family NADH-FMN oxidoreductase RutF
MRRALRALTHGVYVLTVRTGEKDEYLIVSLVMQCSVEPPRVAIALASGARVLRSFRAHGGGVLAILDATQQAAVRRYGTPGGVRHAPADVSRTLTGHPIPPESAFWMGVSIVDELPSGDHVVFVANVVEAGVLDAAATFTPYTLAGSGFPYAG